MRSLVCLLPPLLALLFITPSLSPQVYLSLDLPASVSPISRRPGILLSHPVHYDFVFLVGFVAHPFLYP